MYPLAALAEQGPKSGWAFRTWHTTQKWPVTVTPRHLGQIGLVAQSYL